MLLMFYFYLYIFYMFNKKYIKQSFKYLALFMLSMLSLYMIGNNKLSSEQLVLISTVIVTYCSVIDYLAPTIVAVPENLLKSKCI